MTGVSSEGCNMAASADEDATKKSGDATVPQNEQNTQPFRIISPYDYEALAKGILIQVTDPFEQIIDGKIVAVKEPKRYYENVKLDMAKMMERQAERAASTHKKDVCDSGESEVGKKMEMTPIALSVSRVETKDINKSKDAENLQEHTEADKKSQKLKKESSEVAKTVKVDNSMTQKKEPQPKKNKIPPPKKDQITLPKKDQITLPKKDQITLPKKDQITLPKKDQITLPKKDKKALPKKDEKALPKKDKDAFPIKDKTAPPKKDKPALAIKTTTAPPKEEEMKKLALETNISEDVSDETEDSEKTLSETSDFEDPSDDDYVPTEDEYSDTDYEFPSPPRRKRKKSSSSDTADETSSPPPKKRGKSISSETTDEIPSPRQRKRRNRISSETTDEIPSPPPKKRRNRISSETTDDGESDPDDTEWIYSDDEILNKKYKSVQREQDDGDMNRYLCRLTDWEKQNNRKLIERECEILEEDFKIPLIIWNNLFKYQKTGVKWLLELHMQRCGGILGDEMGLGKTIQVIALLAGLSVSKLPNFEGSYKGLGPVLIVTPTTVMHQWVKELHSWWPQFRVVLMHESGNFIGSRPNLVRSVAKTRGILVTSYVGCVQQINILKNYLWHYVILDEGHKIRNPDSQIANAVKMFKTPHRLIISGSPMQNNLKELWSLFDFIFPGKLGTLPAFMAEFSVPITQGGYANASRVQVATGFKCATVLRDTISPYLLRRMKQDVKSHINLPLKNEQVLFCKLTDEQKSLYLEYINSTEVDSIISGRYKIFVGLINLRKICNHPDLFKGGPKVSKSDGSIYGYWKNSGKMIVVETLLKIWKRQNHKVLIFSQSKQMLNILENFVQIQGYTYLKLDGSTCVRRRQSIITKFNEDSNYFIFLATTRVGGLGINLTGADRVVIYDPDWNPATDTQARERAWRIGQKNQVTIYRLVTCGTIEEKIYHRQIFKQFLTNKVLKNPRQRRFFKSNDLYELFTFQDTDDNTTETSALFAGSGSEVKLDNLSRRVKSRRESSKRAITEPVTDPSSLFHRDKVREMKKLAKMLSKRFKSDVERSSQGSESCEQGMTSDSSTQASLRSHLDEDNNTESSLIRSENEEEMEEHEPEEREIEYAKFEGENVPYLMSRLEYNECETLENELKQEQDDYILEKLFSKSDIKSAMQHDLIMEEGPDDYALVEGEAEKVAKEAVRALKESRKHYNQQTLPVTKPRFGTKSRNKPGQSSNSAGEGVNRNMTSAELLLRMKQRNGLLDANIIMDPEDEEIGLLTDVRNFISHEAEEPNRATTQEIVTKFEDALPHGSSPLFRALLTEICDFNRNSRGAGTWILRHEFQW